LKQNNLIKRYKWWWENKYL